MSPCILVNVDCTMPIANPAMTVGHTNRNRPISAAPSPGMRYRNVYTPEDN